MPISIEEEYIEQEDMNHVCQGTSLDGCDEKKEEEKRNKDRDRERGSDWNGEVNRERAKEMGSRRVLTIPVKSVSCGDFHTAAITNTDRLYLWGSCPSLPFSLSQPTDGSPSSSCSSSSSSFKRDVTGSLNGSPLKVTSSYEIIHKKIE